MTTTNEDPQSTEEKKAPEKFSLAISSKKDLTIKGKDKVIIRGVNLEEGPEILDIFIDADKAEKLLAGVDVTKGAKIQVSAYHSVKENKQGEKTFINNNLTLAGKPKQLVDQHLAVKGYVVKSQGTTKIEGKGYDPYEKLSFTIGVDSPNEKTAYYTVAANEKFFTKNQQPSPGDEVFVQGYLNNEAWKTEESQGVNKILKVDAPIVVGEEKIQEYFKKQANEKQQSQKR